MTHTTKHYEGYCTDEMFEKIKQFYYEPAASNYQDMSDAELICSQMKSSLHFRDIEKELCTRAGLGDMWENADSMEFETVIDMAMFILITQGMKQADSLIDFALNNPDETREYLREVLYEDSASMDDFNEMNSDPYEAVCAAFYGNFNPNDDIFWYNGYVNLVSGSENDFIEQEYNFIDDDDFIEWMINNHDEIFERNKDNMTTEELKRLIQLVNLHDAPFEVREAIAARGWKACKLIERTIKQNEE